jgi:hypothetical protein
MTARRSLYLAQSPDLSARRQLRRITLLASAVVVPLALGGCGNDLKRTLGLEKQSPDAFRVVSRAPLEIPPSFGLRPPEPGAPRPNEPTVTEQSRAAVFGQNQSQRDVQLADRTPGEAALLKAAGATKLDPSIRETVNRESLQLSKESRGLADRLIFWRTPDEPGTAVDAEAEAKRLRENSALGKPVTEGETPIIKRKQRSILDGIL